MVIALHGDLFLAIHLMIAGRVHWKQKGVRLAGKTALAAFDFTTGTLTLTEVGTKKRASLHLVRGERELAALIDPSIFSGIGNAYSDEILHAARLSPTQLTRNLEESEIGRLRDERSPRFGRAWPCLGSPVQRIVYAANEANYCARCQTGGKLLADRALSRLLGKDWPRTLEDLESR